MKPLILILMLLSGGLANAQPAFAVATIRPSAEAVKFESDGETTLSPGTVRMRDVTIESCIKWAYGAQKGQISGPGLLTSERYDITAKADGMAKVDEMKAMMQSLLKERFKLEFHQEKKELRSFALVVGKDGPKLKPADNDEVPLRQNSAMGTVARATTMQEFADFLAGPVERPVVDKTRLAGRWDFAFDFSNYMTDKPKGLDGFLLVLNETLQGDTGLKLVPEKDLVQVMVVDRVERASEN